MAIEKKLEGICVVSATVWNIPLYYPYTDVTV